jgi:hypothetical protein
MAFAKKRRFFKRRSGRTRVQPAESTEPEAGDHSGSVGAEASYLRSSIDSRATVTVILDTGERLCGRIRYYDRDCFSLGLIPRGPNLLIRKSCVRCIIEE